MGLARDDLDLASFDERTLRSLIRGTLAVSGEAMFRATARELTELFGARGAIIAEPVPEAPDQLRSIVTVSARGLTNDDASALAQRRWRELRGQAAPGEIWLATEGGDRSCGIDLVVEGRAVGLIAVIDVARGAPPAAIATLRAFGRAVAAEITRLDQQRLERERSRAMLSHRSALLELAQMDKSELGSAIRRIVQADAVTLGVERVSYWSLADDRSQITCEELYQASTEQFVRGAVLRATDFPAYFDALLSTDPIIAHDARSDPRTAEFSHTYFLAHGITAMLDVPVWRHGRLVGVLCHEHVGGARTWRDEESDFAVSAAGLCSTALEASERRRAEERYEVIARTINDAVWDWNIATQELKWSPGVEAMFRYPLDQVEQSFAWYEQRIHPDDLGPVIQTLETALAGADSIWTREYRILRGDGTTAWVSDRGIIIRDETGAAVRMLGALMDVTERKTFEQRLLVADRMASIGTLAAGVAHEINNPLSYIIANIDYALESLASKRSTDDLVDALREAREGGVQVRAIVRDLRAFSRVEEEERSPVELSRVIDSAINMAWSEIRHRARLVKNLEVTSAVTANEARLAQVVLNLLVNAAQAIPEGAVDANTIRVTTGVDARGFIMIEVRDTGPGIPSAIRARVFDPFFTTKHVGLGTGLGLSICHSIVTGLGGEITLDNAPAGGCVARVFLPRSATADDRAEGAAPPRQAAPHVIKPPLLVIDDDVRAGKAVRRLLQAAWDVVLVTSGGEALDLVTRGQSFEVVLCDLMMPEMTGMDLHAELAAIAPRLADRTVFMTGGTFTERAQEFLARVPNPRIEKPFDRAALNAALAAAAGACARTQDEGARLRAC